MRNLSFVAFLVSAVLAAGLLAWWVPQLPAEVPTHFDGAGNPDGWSTRDGAVAIHATILAGMGGLFLVLALVIPKIPPSLVNIPHRDHWLAPSRRQETLGVIRDYLLILGAATMLFLAAIADQSFRAAVDGGGLGAAFWVLFVGYMVLVLGSVVWLYRRFPAPRGHRITGSVDGSRVGRLP